MKRISLLSLKGGCGKSFVSANLGRGLVRKGYKVGFLDIDVHNPGLHRALGYSIPPSLGLDTQNEYILPSVNEDGSELVTLASHFLESSRITWEGKNKSNLVSQMIEGVIKWNSPDFIVIDSPPGQDECITTLFNYNLWGCIIVLQPSDFSKVATIRVIDLMRDKEIPIIGIIENMSGAICPKCETEFSPFASKTVNIKEFSQDKDIPYIGRVPFVSSQEKIITIFDQITSRVLEITPKKIPSGKVRAKLAREMVKRFLEKKLEG